jgi:hypothetical protein
MKNRRTIIRSARILLIIAVVLLATSSATTAPAHSTTTVTRTGKCPQLVIGGQWTNNKGASLLFGHYWTMLWGLGPTAYGANGGPALFCSHYSAYVIGFTHLPDPHTGPIAACSKHAVNCGPNGWDCRWQSLNVGICTKGAKGGANRQGFGWLPAPL